MTTPDPSWRHRAACAGSGPALFYDLHPAAVAAAKSVCGACSARDDCAAHAVSAGEEFGVWGGLAADERPAPPRPQPGTPGPEPTISDDELYNLFLDAEAGRPAIDHLLDHVWMPTATAYKTLERAVRLGVVERRGRGLHPLRH